MRLVCISDTHLQPWPNIPDGDVLIHAGDATLNGSDNEIDTFAARMWKEPHEHKIFVAGNHDFGFQRRASRFEPLLNSHGITYLQDSAVEIEGVRFWGSPWTPAFMDWAFNLPRGTKLREKWDLIPENTHVLITHGPPFSILDVVRFDERVGCVDLLDAVRRVRPLVHVFGHIHECPGRVENGGTTFVNASTCDEDYRSVNPPIVVDIQAGVS